jgi:hypothetical protein
MRTIALAIALTFAVFPALAEQTCQQGLDEVQKEIADTKMPPAKETQVRALLEQVARACKENNTVVAQAGLDQVRAILEEQKKASL